MAATLLPRDVLRWVQAIGVSPQLRNVRRDIGEGTFVAAIISHYFPTADLPTAVLAGGASYERRRDVWDHLERALRSAGVGEEAVPSSAIAAAVSFEPGAAVALLRLLHTALTASHRPPAAGSQPAPAQPPATAPPVPAYALPTTSLRVRQASGPLGGVAAREQDEVVIKSRNAAIIAAARESVAEARARSPPRRRLPRRQRGATAAPSRTGGTLGGDSLSGQQGGPQVISVKAAGEALVVARATGLAAPLPPLRAPPVLPPMHASSAPESPSAVSDRAAASTGGAAEERTLEAAAAAAMRVSPARPGNGAVISTAPHAVVEVFGGVVAVAAMGYYNEDDGAAFFHACVAPAAAAPPLAVRERVWAACAAAVRAGAAGRLVALGGVEACGVLWGLLAPVLTTASADVHDVLGALAALAAMGARYFQIAGVAAARAAAAADAFAPLIRARLGGDPPVAAAAVAAAAAWLQGADAGSADMEGLAHAAAFLAQGPRPLFCSALLLAQIRAPLPSPIAAALAAAAAGGVATAAPRAATADAFTLMAALFARGGGAEITPVFAQQGVAAVAAAAAPPAASDVLVAACDAAAAALGAGGEAAEAALRVMQLAAAAGADPAVLEAVACGLAAHSSHPAPPGLPPLLLAALVALPPARRAAVLGDPATPALAAPPPARPFAAGGAVAFRADPLPLAAPVAAAVAEAAPPVQAAVLDVMCAVLLASPGGARADTPQRAGGWATAMASLGAALVAAAGGGDATVAEMARACAAKLYADLVAPQRPFPAGTTAVEAQEVAISFFAAAAAAAAGRR